MFDSGEDIEGVVYQQGLSYVPEIIQTELISKHHDEGTLASRKLENLLPGRSTKPVVATYRYLPVAGKTYRWICDGLPMSIDWKDTSYDSILIVVDRLTKMVHSKPAQMIDAPGLAEIISDVVI